MCWQNGPSGGAEKDFGMNYLALNDLFQIQNVRKDVDYEINVQMVEIYNEQVRDLLVAESSITKYPCVLSIGVFFFFFF